MNIRVIEDSACDEEEIIITCHQRTPLIEKIVDELGMKSVQASHRGKEYVVNLKDILFFETDNEIVYLHQPSDAYRTKYRLYELEKVLPKSFIRVSKSAIVNVSHIQSVERKLTSSRSIQFYHSYKTVFVSRLYYPLFRKELDERSFL